jgi:hypothetical protein
LAQRYRRELKITTYLQLRQSTLVDLRASRLFWLKSTVLLAFCVGLSMSRALWIGPRSYPSAPVSSLFPAIDGSVAIGFYVALFVLAAIALVKRESKWLIVAFLAIVAVFCLADQTRWQPWVFLYGFLLATVALGSGNGADGERRALNIARLIVGFTYIFSGLQKANLNFVVNDFPCAADHQRISTGDQSPACAGHGGPVAADRLRHRPVDPALSPRRADRGRGDAPVHPGDVRPRRARLERHRLAVDGCDGDLRHRAVFRCAASFVARDRVEPTGSVTPYPETRVYKAIARSVCGSLRDPAQLVLIVREQRMFFSTSEVGFRCSQL